MKVKNVRFGSLKFDLILDDVTRLEHLKEMSDKWVLTNIVSSILITSEFVKSCQAEDVIIEAVLEERSYQMIKNYLGQY